ncbi:MAG: cytochrome C [Anaerolineae bacterium]|nr:cytochrome C [Gloeobacterales cyanobacterium ES-bin-313]
MSTKIVQIASGFVVLVGMAYMGSWGVQAEPTENLPSQYALGRDLYRQDCSTCHLAIPPGIFPTETWQSLLQESYHYGARIQLPTGPERLLVWQYLRDYSRTLREKEKIPFTFAESRYFRALHPKVDFPIAPTFRSCLQCHPGASGGDFLSASTDTLEKAKSTERK